MKKSMQPTWEVKYCRREKDEWVPKTIQLADDEVLLRVQKLSVSRDVKAVVVTKL